MTQTFDDLFRQDPQDPHYVGAMMRDKLAIDSEGDFGKKHGQWLDELAEANDDLGTCQGWCFTNRTVRGKPKQADYVRIPVIEIVFEHGIVVVNYELTLLSKKLIHRIDEEVEVRTERWVFTDAELAVKGLNCKGDDEFVATVKDVEHGVVVQRNGNVTNRWEDGVFGVPKNIAKLADDVESLVASNGEVADNWRSVKVNDDGTCKWIRQ